MAKTALQNALARYKEATYKKDTILKEFNTRIENEFVLSFESFDFQVYQEEVKKLDFLKPFVSLPKTNPSIELALLQAVNIIETGYGYSRTDTGKSGSFSNVAYNICGDDYYFILDQTYMGHIFPIKDGGINMEISQDDLFIAALCGLFLLSRNRDICKDICTCVTAVSDIVHEATPMHAHERFAAACDVIAESLQSGNLDGCFAAQGKTRIEPISNFVIASGRFIPKTVLMDNCPTLKLTDFPGYVGERVKPSESISEVFTLNPSRKYTEQEALLMQKIPAWYVMNKESTQIAKLVNKTTGTNNEIRNIMLRGPAGTGKTESAKAIASLLGLPYVAMTCSSDTEIFDFFGQSIPDKTGKITFAETPFIQAIKNGWLVEVQEPTVIAKEGVLVGLNGLLDRGRSVVLPTGEVVRRHEDCVVILTTNVSYSGCNGLNQSVISRMQGVYDIELPSEDEIVNRVMRVTGAGAAQDKYIISKMVSVATQINEFLLGNDIDDGICGVREITDWATFYSITGDITESAKRTVLSKATVDSEYRDSLCGLVEAVFG